MSKMTYCGLDYHKNRSQLCLMDSEGKVLDEIGVKSSEVVRFLSNRRDLRIGIEASGGVFHISEKLKDAGHDVRIINPVQFRAIGIGGKKTDRKDAYAIATALRLNYIPEVHQKSLYSRRIGSLLTSSDLCVRMRTQIVCHVRGILREYGLVMPKGVTQFWVYAETLAQEVECSSVSKSLLQMIDQARRLREQAKEIEKELMKIFKSDERAQRLNEVPGVGELAALSIVSSIDDINRFKSAKHMGSYFGLTPRERSSGEKRRLGGITKAGNEMTRRYLIHGARAFLTRSVVLGSTIRWAKRIEKRQGTNKAVVALAHKNARICYALLKRGHNYNKQSRSQRAA